MTGGSCTSSISRTGDGGSEKISLDLHKLREEYKELFIENGGEQWDLVESLNNSDLWIKLLKDLVVNH